MTVPTQRGGANSGGTEPAVLTIIVDGQRRLEDTVATGFSTVHASIDRLRDETLHRRDFDRYREERAAEYLSARMEHDRDISAVRKDIADNEAKRIARGRYVLTTLIALAAILVALASLVIAHF